MAYFSRQMFAILMALTFAVYVGATEFDSDVKEKKTETDKNEENVYESEDARAPKTINEVDQNSVSLNENPLLSHLLGEAQSDDNDVDAQLLLGTCCSATCAKGESCNSITCSCASNVLTSCLSILNTVITPSGKKTLAKLDTYEKVLTLSQNGDLKFEPVLLDTHPLPNLKTWFFKVETENHKLILTSQHYIHVGYSVENSKLIKSDELSIGQPLIIYPTSSANDGIAIEYVKEIGVVHATGISNPIVASGRILVGNILTSVYSDDIPALNVKHQHSFFWIIRQMFYVFNENYPLGGFYSNSGMPLWAHYILQAFK